MFTFPSITFTNDKKQNTYGMAKVFHCSDINNVLWSTDASIKIKYTNKISWPLSSRRRSRT